MADVEGWEARMAARARERQRDGFRLLLNEEDREFDRRLAALANDHRRQLAAAMTLARAVELTTGPGWSCACVGEPYCCRHLYAIARLTVRAAHIAVKAMDEVARRG